MTLAGLEFSDHPVFRSVTMTPMDAVLCELAFKTYEFLKEASPNSAVFATILSDLRGEYAEDAKLDPKSIIAFADKALREVAQSIGVAGDATLFNTWFAELPLALHEPGMEADDDRAQD